MSKVYHLTVVASAEQLASIIETGARVTLAPMGNGPAFTLTTSALKSAKSAATRTKTKRAYTRKGPTTASASATPTIANLVFDYFKQHPNDVVRVRELAAVIKRHKFRSGGHTAIHNMFKAMPNAPVRKVGTGMYQYIAPEA